MVVQPLAPVESRQLCVATLKSGQPCRSPAWSGGLCIRHVPAAVAARPKAAQHAHAARRLNAERASEPNISRHVAADGERLRSWIREEMQRRGHPDVADFAAACGLAKYKLTYFLSGPGQLLRLRSIEAIANYCDVSPELLIDLQGGFLPAKLQAYYQNNPPGSVAMLERGANAGAARRGRKWSPETAAKFKAAMADPALKARSAARYSRTTLQRRSEDGTRPPWQRWLAAQMLSRDVDRQRLAGMLGIAVVSVYQLFRRSKTAPRVRTVARLEELFGPMRADAILAIREARSLKAGGKASQASLRKRLEKWTRERLEKELASIGAPIPKELQNRPWGKPLGRDAYRMFMQGRAAVARKGLTAPLHTLGVKPAQQAVSPAGHLRYMLSGLKRRPDSRFYQCQGCGQIWILNGRRKRGELCRPCWDGYLPQLNSWRMLGRNGKPPSAPRRKGGQLMASADIQQRIIAMLRYRLGIERPVGDEANEYRTLGRTEKMLAESRHPWCQRATQLLAQL